jgi:DNA-binding NarL/FixJ family response regulator
MQKVMTAYPVKIVFVGHNHFVRLGLQEILERETDIRLVGMVAPSKAEAIIQAAPHLVILEMPTEMDAGHIVQKIKGSVPAVKVLLLSRFEDVACARKALSAGVDEIVLSVQPPAILVAAIKCLFRSEAATLDGDGSAAATASKDPVSVKGSGILTKREREIIPLIGQGLSNREIGDRLCISTITVRHHLTSIFDKLGVASRNKLLIRAHQDGLVEVSESGGEEP